MKNSLLIILLLIISVPVLNSCQIDEGKQVIRFQFNEYEVVFVPPSQENDSYMDTFIDLKAKYPQEISSPEKVTMYSEDLPVDYELYNNSFYLMKDEQVIFSIEQTMSQAQLVETLEAIADTGNFLIY